MFERQQEDVPKHTLKRFACFVGFAQGRQVEAFAVNGYTWS